MRTKQILPLPGRQGDAQVDLRALFELELDRVRDGAVHQIQTTVQFACMHQQR